MEVKIEQKWKEILNDEFDKNYFKELTNFVKLEYQTKTIYPPASKIFAAFDSTPFDDVKVVILGQDPYHGPNQANGLSFSVNDGIKFPPSLQNIYKELSDDLGIEIPLSGDLSHWAKQGVLMLNATLTVKAHSPNSHKDLGWEKFTDFIIKEISDKKENVVFVLWGAFAQKKAKYIDSAKHFIIQSAHPSPFSVYKGFYRSKPFSKINEYLNSKGKQVVNW